MESVPVLCAQGDEQLSLMVLTGPVPSPFSPVERTEPRALVQAGLVTGTCPQEQVTCHLLDSES